MDLPRGAEYGHWPPNRARASISEERIMNWNASGCLSRCDRVKITLLALCAVTAAGVPEVRQGELTGASAAPARWRHRRRRAGVLHPGHSGT